MRIEFTAFAEAELSDNMTFYENQQTGLGDEFLHEILQTLERIALHPMAWQKFSQNTRRALTKRFPFGVIYEIRKADILVLAIANLHRDPDLFTSRTV